jgi:hypothetical protein
MTRKTTDPDLATALAPVTEYGCVKCQRERKPCWHVQGLDPEYDAHLPWQSKQGLRSRPARIIDAFRRLVEIN